MHPKCLFELTGGDPHASKVGKYMLRNFPNILLNLDEAIGKQKTEKSINITIQKFRNCTSDAKGEHIPQSTLNSMAGFSEK